MIYKTHSYSQWMRNSSAPLTIILFLIIISFSSSAQTITTIAGGGAILGDGGAATAAKVALPTAGSFDATGSYYFGQDAGGPRARKIDAAGIINTVAGTGVYGYSGDNGPATLAQLATAHCRVDGAGNVYIADYYNFRLRKVDVSTGIIHTIAGDGTTGHTGDGGPASASRIVPTDVCIDTAGNLYVCDSSRIRKINTAGIITTIAGNNIGGYSGDDGPATVANILVAYGICLDALGNLYFACNGGTRIRKVDMNTGIITTIAGTGTYLYNGDEIPATAAQFKCYGLAFDNNKNLYFADYGNQRIREIDTFGIIHTVAGTGVFGYSGDNGPATAAQIYDPEGVAIDICGSVYIADEANNRIRKITMPPILTIPTITLASGEGSSVPIGNTVTITATVTNAGSSYIIHWLNHGIEFTTTTVPSVTYTKGPGIDTITARVVSTATYGCYDSTTSAASIIMAGTSGVAAPGLSQGEEVLRIYPNPANDLLHIDYAAGSTSLSLGEGRGEALYRLLNIVGTPLQQGTLNTGSNSIPVSSLPLGMYMIEVTDSKGTRTITKIIKQ